MHDDEDTTSNTASAPKMHVVVKKVGVQRLAKDQAKEKVLNTEEKKKQKEYDKLVAELDAAKKAQQEAKKHSSEQTTVTHHRSTATTHHSSSSNGAGRGDMDTADSGKIVGNKNTKIYHVPGQAGYRMNSANAVYFNSEQDAINAGYRKAKR
ncbi:prophage Lp1 protein 66 [Lactobacillus amylolyticus DSM 11664]|uniref:sunset domain-containing protein n=1 Tax=Lactobacillus amylolyticus TaxID=83683 RepID=UPI000305F35D|nr:Ada metal-binding domain-containing protein [Lactobacillus amylolyticus]KRL18715.1 prophage Lp1 protein 66 [Lactobacillus amylolyticus DSM 11664]